MLLAPWSSNNVLFRYRVRRPKCERHCGHAWLRWQLHDPERRPLPCQYRQDRVPPVGRFNMGDRAVRCTLCTKIFSDNVLCFRVINIAVSNNTNSYLSFQWILLSAINIIMKALFNLISFNLRWRMGKTIRSNPIVIISENILFLLYINDDLTESLKSNWKRICFRSSRVRCSRACALNPISLAASASASSLPPTTSISDTCLTIRRRSFKRCFSCAKYVKGYCSRVSYIAWI